MESGSVAREVDRDKLLSDATLVHEFLGADSEGAEAAHPSRFDD
jgi:hypothetical protein